MKSNILKTTTAETFPARYYRLPMGTQFALISGEVKTLAELEQEMGTGTICRGCFYPDSDPLMRGYLLRTREMTLAEQYAAKQESVKHLNAAQTVVSEACRAAFDASDWG